MDKVLNLYKKSGETPLECMLRFKAENQEYKDLPMTYAGRLDPLAEGALLVLAGDKVHKKEEFLNLEKEYEVEVLFGLSTDTLDVLGIQKSSVDIFHLDEGKTQETLKSFIGKNIFEYPSFSSKTINGKPLFEMARNGDLENVEIPKKEVEIYDLEILNSRKINAKDLLIDIENKIKKVNGDFRQDLIIQKWKEVLMGNDFEFSIIKIRAKVSSGTYMRTLACEWGKKNNMNALAYHIVRTKIGEYEIKDSIK